MTISTKDDFSRHVAAIEGRGGYTRPAAFAIGVATIAPSGKVLDTAYSTVNLAQNFGSAAVFADVIGHEGGTATYALDGPALDRMVEAFAPFLGETQADPASHANVSALLSARDALRAPALAVGTRRVVAAFIGSLSDAPVDAHDVYLRLHLLSHRKVRPHGQNLDGIFGLLNNVVWTNHGPMDPDGFDLVRGQLKAAGLQVQVDGLDKFPRMTDYVIPTGVRIADASRVRLGAHLADGTTVMHEGFCNFNAGTLGTAMVEGRISAGVVVGDHSDVGGGASIMGTLSGGGKEVISLGERCLVGANAGLGISLGDNCIIEAGTYVTAGSVVKLPDGSLRKARELSGTSDMLIRRNSQSGALEVLPNSATPNWGGLNAALHKN